MIKHKLKPTLSSRVRGHTITAIVPRQAIFLALGKALAQSPIDARVRLTPTVDRLVGIADHHQRAMHRGQFGRQLELDSVAVLELVDDEVSTARS